MITRPPRRGGVLGWFDHKRILLLDDDLSMQRLLKHLLKRNGFRVDCYSTGTEVIAAMARREYDAILLDIMMPHAGGLTVLKHLNEKLPTHLRRVILVTGTTLAVTEPWRGMIFGIVQKPFLPAEITGLVAACVADQP